MWLLLFLLFLIFGLVCSAVIKICSSIPAKFEMINCPSLLTLYIKGLMKSTFHGQGHLEMSKFRKERIVISSTDWSVDQSHVQKYMEICGYDSYKPDFLPMCYLETCFIRPMICLISSPKFGLSPLGLIHIRQTFTQNGNLCKLLDKKPFTCVCSVDVYRESEKGIEVDISLKVYNERELCVLEGVSTLLSRSASVRSKKGESHKTNSGQDNTHPEEELTTLDEFTVKHLGNLGVQYAHVSGDWNPHHLWPWSSRLLGYKAPIAHGMWTMARCLAHLDQKEMFDTESKLQVDVQFKRPIFLPSVSVFSFEQEEDQDKVQFKVRDEKTGVPQLVGTMMCL